MMLLLSMSSTRTLCALLCFIWGVGTHGYSPSSRFLGQPLIQHHGAVPRNNGGGAATTLEMRKQKASDKRTRRQQRGDVVFSPDNLMTGSITSSPMNGKSWNHKQSSWYQQQQQQQQGPTSVLPVPTTLTTHEASTGGRGRSRKRSALYNSLSLYHNKFLSLLTQEYKQEVRISSYY